MTTHNSNDERLRRWRLMLGEGQTSLSGRDAEMDALLAKLYGRGRKGKRGRGRGNGLGSGQNGQGQGQGAGQGGMSGGGRMGSMEASMPNVSDWLGDIREYFPETVVQVMQQDLIDQIGLRAFLSEPDVLEQIQPDVNLVATLMMLKDAIPNDTKHTARILVKKVVDELMRRLENPMRQAIQGAINRARRKRNPKHKEIDWPRTVRANLKHYQPEYKTVIPELLVGFGRHKRQSQHHIIICIDQSGSMAPSMVYSSIFGAVMASIPALKTSMVLFDTSVVDITPQLSDPVDVLFGTMLGGGTDINRAVGYCQTLIERPDDTIMILITDLYEGGSHHHLLQRVESIVNSGVQLVTLLALSDSGTPSYDSHMAADFAERGVVSFACTPDLFPELMAATINRRDLGSWAAQNEIDITHPVD